MKYLIILTVCLTMGCTKTLCDLHEKLIEGISTSIATEFNCKNINEIKASIDPIIKKLNICKEKANAKKISAKGPVGDLICPYVAGPIAALIFNNILPKKWECSIDNSSGKMKQLVESACKKVL